MYILMGESFGYYGEWGKDEGVKCKTSILGIYDSPEKLAAIISMLEAMPWTGGGGKRFIFTEKTGEENVPFWSTRLYVIDCPVNENIILDNEIVVTRSVNSR